MDYIPFFLIRYYPFWAIPLAFYCFEWGVHKYEKNTCKPAIISFIFAGLLTVGAVLWVLFGGFVKASV